MVSFRLIKPDEVEEAERLFSEKYPWAALPNWPTTYVKVKDDKIVGLYDIQTKIIIGSLVSFDNSPITTTELIAHADGRLTAAGIQQYEFIVPDENPKAQKFLEKRYGLEPREEIKHKIYFVRK